MFVDRRRQLGRAGSDELRQRRPLGHARRARRGPGGVDVELPDASRIADAPNVTVRTHTEVVAVDGDDWLRTITLRDTRNGDRRRRGRSRAVHLHRRRGPHGLGQRRRSSLVDAGGYLVTGRDLRDPPSPAGSSVDADRETRTRSRRHVPACSPPVTSDEARRSACRPRSVRAPWPSSSSTASSPRDDDLTGPVQRGRSRHPFASVTSRSASPRKSGSPELHQAVAVVAVGLVLTGPTAAQRQSGLLAPGACPTRTLDYQPTP